DLLDEVNMSEIQIKHLRCFGMVRRGCQEVAFKQKSLEEITVSVAQLQANLDQATQLLERGFYLSHLSVDFSSEIFNPLLDRGLQQLLFVVKVEIYCPLRDFCLFSHAINSGSLKAM